jgi:hypothetical protein
MLLLFWLDVKLVDTREGLCLFCFSNVNPPKLIADEELDTLNNPSPVIFELVPFLILLKDPFFTIFLKTGEILLGYAVGLYSSL